MINHLKFTDTDNNKLFVTGCPHLKHDPKWNKPIWAMRGYTSSEDMTRGIVRQINETCLATDTLLCLGDFCLNCSQEDFLTLVRNINCKMLFVRGNHNNPWEKMYLQECINLFGYEVIGYEWLNKITYLGDYVEFNWNKQLFLGFHYPIFIFNHMSHGAISLVSHSHGTCEFSHPNNKECKQIDCGWDVWRKPIGFKEIMDCANKKQIFKGDQH